jgi:hypothetical protein
MSDATDLEELALRKSMKLERYADVLAHMMHFGDERAAEVAARFGLSLEAWRAVDRAWSSELALGIKRQQHDQGLRFSATFHKRRQRLAREMPSIEAIGDGPAPIAITPAPPPAKAPAPQVELPTYMRVATGGAGPFAPPVTPPPPAPAPLAPPAMPKPDPLMMTVTGANPDEPLPFVEGVPATAALSSAVEHAQVVQGPKPSPPAKALGTTAPADAGRIAEIARRLLPFSGAPPADPLTGRASVVPGESPLNAASPGADDAPALTLEQHASLCVELARHADRAGEILARYGLDAEGKVALDTHYRAVVAASPEQRAAWDKAYRTYDAWLASKR